MTDEAAAAAAARLKRRCCAASLGMSMPLVGYAYAGRFGRGVAAFVVAAGVIWLLSHLPFGLLDYRPVLVVAVISHFLACVAFCLDLDRIVKRGEDRTDLWYQDGAIYCVLFAVWIGAITFAHLANEQHLFKARQVCKYSWPMEPALRPNECVLVAPKSDWKRGDIVTYVPEPGLRVISFGRVIGLPGDVVAIRDGDPIVNGAPLPQRPTPLPPQEALSRWLTASAKSFSETNGDRSYQIVREKPLTDRYQNIAERRVADAHLYVLGDARDRVNDSRSGGDVPVSSALGTPVMVSRSPDWGRFGEPVR